VGAKSYGGRIHPSTPVLTAYSIMKHEEKPPVTSGLTLTLPSYSNVSGGVTRVPCGILEINEE